MKYWRETIPTDAQQTNYGESLSRVAESLELIDRVRAQIIGRVSSSTAYTLVYEGLSLMDLIYRPEEGKIYQITKEILFSHCLLDLTVGNTAGAVKWFFLLVKENAFNRAYRRNPEQNKILQKPYAAF